MKPFIFNNLKILTLPCARPSASKHLSVDALSPKTLKEASLMHLDAWLRPFFAYILINDQVAPY
ncbi:MAG: hypothetical protein DHS20C11_30280 [Lysobacteraceae bacterium]|nr:MAG: hypothetical protein DHS20C11_30280 [Xanthomonadaceae bacterium]